MATIYCTALLWHNALGLYALALCVFQDLAIILGKVQKRRCACADLRVNSTGCRSRVTVTVLPPARV